MFFEWEKLVFLHIKSFATPSITLFRVNQHTFHHSLTCNSVTEKKFTDYVVTHSLHISWHRPMIKLTICQKITLKDATNFEFHFLYLSHANCDSDTCV